MWKGRRSTALAGILAVALAAGTGCARRPAERVAGYREQRSAPAPVPPRRDQTLRGSDTLQGRDLADRIMLASEGMLGDAHVRHDRDLVVALGAKANTDVVPDLLRILIRMMHATYPGKDVTVLVQDAQRRPLVRASLNAQDGDVSYTFP